MTRRHRTSTNGNNHHKPPIIQNALKWKIPISQKQLNHYIVFNLFTLTILTNLNSSITNNIGSPITYGVHNLLDTQINAIFKRDREFQVCIVCFMNNCNGFLKNFQIGINRILISQRLGEIIVPRDKPSRASFSTTLEDQFRPLYRRI